MDVLSICVFLGVLAHVESLRYWFPSYDSIALIQTSRISSFGDLWTIFTSPLMYGTTYVESGLFYRLVVNLTYELGVGSRNQRYITSSAPNL